MIVALNIAVTVDDQVIRDITLERLIEEYDQLIDDVVAELANTERNYIHGKLG